MRRPGSGNGFVVCARGHRHWGRFGAAGLLLADGDDVLLQHRAAWTHEGDTWSVPGGAIDAGEDPVSAALREAHEEAALPAERVEPVGSHLDDHGGWSYTTVLARPAPPAGPGADTARGAAPAAAPVTRPDPRPAAASAGAETAEIRWVARSAVTGLRLHPGFAATWPAVARPPAALTVVVDVANVMGSRPDGWWRDRAGAATRWWGDLLAGVAAGWPTAHLPAHGDDHVPAARDVSADDARGSDALFPRLHLVLEGQARAATAPVDAAPPWAHRLVTVHRAPGSGDDAIVELAVRLGPAAERLVVVTADRGLRERVRATAPTAALAGPRSLVLAAAASGPPSSPRASRGRR